MAGTWRVEVAFDSPGPQANGLAAAPEGLWICDQADDRIYLTDYDSGKALHHFPCPGRNLSGMAAGGGAVFATHNKRPSMVFKHNPETGHCLGVLVLPDYTSGVHGCEWIETDGQGTLWVTRPGIFVIDLINDEPEMTDKPRAHEVGPRGEQLHRLEGGQLLRRIPFPAPRSHGIFFDFDQPGKNEPYTIICNATGVNKIFRLDPADGEVLEQWQVEGFEIHGMTRDRQGRIWVCDAITNRIGIVQQ